MFAALLPLLATPALAHLAMYHLAMYGLKPEDPWSWDQIKPLDNMLFKDWWFHGYINEPPADGVFMELPAGGTFVGEIACTKAFTSLGGKNNETGAPPLPLMACDKPGDNGAMGAIHATDTFPGPAYGQSKSVRGVGLGIAYESDVYKLKPEDFVVISVNHTAPWLREVGFQIPAGLPPCPEGGCHCLWGWVPDPMNVQQMYSLGYRCNVTGETGTEYPARPQVARKCFFDKNNCTSGAKQMHFIDQLEGNNNFQGKSDPAFYNYDYGFHDGAQTDIWELDDGATWNKNASDLAPAPWLTLTSVPWSTSMNPTWTITPDSRGNPTGGPRPSAPVVTPPAASANSSALEATVYTPPAQPSVMPTWNVLPALPSTVRGGESGTPTGKPTGKCHGKRRLAH